LENIDGYITTDSLVKSMTVYMNGQSHWLHDTIHSYVKT
jgi:hypothetical protein